MTPSRTECGICGGFGIDHCEECGMPLPNNFDICPELQGMQILTAADMKNLAEANEPEAEEENE